MTEPETLFDIHSSDPSPLERARARFAAAQDQYDQCDAWEDESGEAMPSEVARELSHARRQLAIEESAEVGRRTPQPPQMPGSAPVRPASEPESVSWRCACGCSWDAVQDKDGQQCPDCRGYDTARAYPAAMCYRGNGIWPQHDYDASAKTK